MSKRYRNDVKAGECFVYAPNSFAYIDRGTTKFLTVKKGSKERPSVPLGWQTAEEGYGATTCEVLIIPHFDVSKPIVTAIEHRAQCCYDMYCRIMMDDKNEFKFVPAGDSKKVIWSATGFVALSAAELEVARGVWKTKLKERDEARKARERAMVVIDYGTWWD